MFFLNNSAVTNNSTSILSLYYNSSKFKQNYFTRIVENQEADLRVILQVGFYLFYFTLVAAVKLKTQLLFVSEII